MSDLSAGHLGGLPLAASGGADYVAGMTFDTIGIVGGGAFGTALAETLCRAGRDVVLWARNAAVVDEINTQRTNTTYLPGISLSPALRSTTDIAVASARRVVLLVTPVQQSRGVMLAMRPHLRSGHTHVGSGENAFHLALLLRETPRGLQYALR